MRNWLSILITNSVMVQQSSSLIIQQNFSTRECTPEAQMEMSTFRPQMTAIIFYPNYLESS